MTSRGISRVVTASLISASLAVSSHVAASEGTSPHAHLAQAATATSTLTTVDRPSRTWGLHRGILHHELRPGRPRAVALPAASRRATPAHVGTLSLTQGATRGDKGTGATSLIATGDSTCPYRVPPGQTDVDFAPTTASNGLGIRVGGFVQQGELSAGTCVTPTGDAITGCFIENADTGSEVLSQVADQTPPDGSSDTPARGSGGEYPAAQDGSFCGTLITVDYGTGGRPEYPGGGRNVGEIASAITDINISR